MNEYYYEQGLNAFDAGDYENAIKYFQEFLSLYPMEPTIYDNIALCYIEMKEYRKAIPFLEKAIKIFPGLKEAYQNLAYVYKQLGDNDKALVYFRKMNLLKAFNDGRF